MPLPSVFRIIKRLLVDNLYCGLYIFVLYCKALDRLCNKNIFEMYKKKKICTNCRVYRYEKRKKPKMQHCVGQIPQYHNPMTNYYPTPVPYQYQLTTPAAQKVRTYELKDSFLKFYLLLQCFLTFSLAP